MQVGGNNSYRIDTSGLFTWYDGAGGTRMTLNSTGLGVGEAASVSRLQARGSTSDSSAYILYGKASSGNVICFMRNDGRFLVGNGTTDNLIVTETGNVGVGVTPSTAWNTGGNLQVGALGALYHNQTLGATDLTYNSIRTGTDTYQYLNGSSLQASRFQQRDGSFRWFNAPSGTAGNAITFTQAMTLDASGRLLIGTATSGTAAGDGIIKLGVRGHVISNNGASIANNSFVDVTVNTSGSGYQGFLSVSCTDESQANNRTQATYSIFGRGASATITQIATANGSGGGASFTVTIPSNGVIRITNTSGVVCTISAQFFGGTSF
jgi:hypothetical protein